MSRSLAVVAASAVLLPMLAAASESPVDAASTLYDENMRHLLERHPSASESQLAQPVRMLSDRGIRLGETNALQVAGLWQGVHVGEVVSMCAYFGFFTSDRQCVATEPFYTGADCMEASSAAANAWTPQTTQWTVDGGNYRLTWLPTEELAGFPGLLGRGGTFHGSGCLFEYRWSPNDELVIGYGVGEWRQS